MTELQKYGKFGALLPNPESALSATLLHESSSHLDKLPLDKLVGRKGGWFIGVGASLPSGNKGFVFMYVSGCTIKNILTSAELN